MPRILRTKRVRTVVYLQDELRKDLEDEAQERGTSLSKRVEQLLQEKSMSGKKVLKRPGGNGVGPKKERKIHIPKNVETSQAVQATADFVGALSAEKQQILKTYYEIVQAMYARGALKVHGNHKPESLQSAMAHVDHISRLTLDACAKQLWEPTMPELAVFFGGVLGSMIAGAFSDPRNLKKGKIELTEEMFDSLGKMISTVAHVTAYNGIEASKHSNIVMP